MRVRSLEAVLFDMDGTLLDSEKVWDVALDDLAAELGGPLDPAVRASVVGSSLARTVGILHEAFGVDDTVDPAGSAQFLVERTAGLFRTDLVWKPGAEELLTAVAAAGVPVALVTSTHRGLTEIALDTLGRHHFTATVCGDEVAHPKPAPDPYLRAAQLCGADPRHCVAIEDSPLGIASAEAAGCAVVAVPSEVEVSPADSTTVLDTLVGLTVDDLDALVAG
ncbi:HAD family hydrolase [Jatrophihabitans endophyticus]|uniref:HAD family hydrolase n=1 Tax=Jatrophihabitans endophyticus TaxID=1206085 RepID=UPI001A0F2F5F|nr:HAD family phosphatase [Jatrophihabitans endophyticus]